MHSSTSAHAQQYVCSVTVTGLHMHSRRSAHVVLGCTCTECIHQAGSYCSRLELLHSRRVISGSALRWRTKLHCIMREVPKFWHKIAFAFAFALECCRIEALLRNLGLRWLKAASSHSSLTIGRRQGRHLTYKGGRTLLMVPLLTEHAKLPVSWKQVWPEGRQALFKKKAWESSAGFQTIRYNLHIHGDGVF
jgi:hypothetical protein